MNEDECQKDQVCGMTSARIEYDRELLWKSNKIFVGNVTFSKNCVGGLIKKINILSSNQSIKKY